MRKHPKTARTNLDTLDTRHDAKMRLFTLSPKKDTFARVLCENASTALHGAESDRV